MVNRHMKKKFSTSLTSGKCKSKPQWDITSHLSEWLLSKRQQITSIGDNMEESEPLCIVGGNVDWCTTVENRGSSKN